MMTLAPSCAKSSAVLPRITARYSSSVVSVFFATKELLAINPDFDINRLQIGDELTLSNAVPYLTVMVTERQNYVEDIQYDITYTDDATMYKGDYKVLSKGVYGTADVVADVTYVNGEETERTVISSVTLTEPVTEQRAQGTKARPSWYPTGSFRWPTSPRPPNRVIWVPPGSRPTRWRPPPSAPRPTPSTDS